MINIGVVNIDVSHPKTFSTYLNNGNRARYTAVYNDGFRGDDEVCGFIKNAGLIKRCSTIEELAYEVDIGFIQGCNWDKHLQYAKPFFDLNKPVFIDKPISGNMPDCLELEKLASRGKVILGSSSVRYAEEITTLTTKLRENKSKILNVYGTSGVDEFNYGVHIVEGIGGLLGTGAVSCTYMGSGKSDVLITENFFVRFENDACAVYTTCQGRWMPFNMVVMTDEGNYSFSIDTGKIYGVMLDKICDYMETGVNTLATVNALTESVKIMLAGKMSREKGGGEVKLADIPGDYKGYDGYVFEKEYALKAAKIYI